MKASKSMIATLREEPREAVISSHRLMLRAGLIKKIAMGLYAYMPMGFRVFQKVSSIIREELNNEGLLEVKPTVIIPGELWKASGRWDKMKGEMLKAVNRTGQDMVVSPTAEEAFVAIMKDTLKSYKDMPVNIYQINTKYRDEIRPRYGVMRGREFTMMDAYSFDTDEEKMDISYRSVARAYRRLFFRMGLSVISVKADTGFIGGSSSEEFMVESEVGDDTLLICPSCNYAANQETASCRTEVSENENASCPMEKVHCPGVESIKEMENFFGVSSKNFIKLLIYKLENAKEPFIAVAIRGDLDVSEAKLAALFKATEATLASEEDVIKYGGAPHGFVGPLGISKCPLLADLSVVHTDEKGEMKASVHDCITGAGEADYDIRHVEPLRDFTPDMTGDVRVVKAGDGCPKCKEKLYTKRGNELGHIFKLGSTYSRSLSLTYLDKDGKDKNPLMGCYGIGVDRTLAGIIEEHHDEAGIIWPVSVAPYECVIIPVSTEGRAMESALALYESLLEGGVDVILDDRSERAGVKFKDADLLGFPVRLVISEKKLPLVEIKRREERESFDVDAKEASSIIFKIIKEMKEALLPEEREA